MKAIFKCKGQDIFYLKFHFQEMLNGQVKVEKLMDIKMKSQMRCYMNIIN